MPISRRTNPTGWLRAHYDKAAAKYDKKLAFFDRTVFAGGREWVCSQARGDTLEVAIGTGLNLLHYPAAARLTAIDVSPAMLELAQRRAEKLGRDVDLRVADAQAMPFADASFDTVVSTLSLCTIPDDEQAVAECFRVLRPGGRFVLLEHVRSPHRLVRLGQRMMEQLTLRIEGDHQLREPARHLVAQGFVIERRESSKWGVVERLVVRKPASGASGRGLQRGRTA